MADIWVVLLIVGFFGLCVALVRGCDRMIGADDGGELDAPEQFEALPREDEAVGASQ